MPDADDGPVSDREREEWVAALRRHLSDGRLDLEQFDGRLVRLYAAETRATARESLAGLPLLATPARGRRNRRRHGESDDVQPHWVATEELFRDPSSGRVMRVWIDPTDGTRHYAQAEP
jgi:hypothetical protein